MVIRFGRIGISLFIVLAIIQPQTWAEARRTLHGLDSVIVIIDPLHPDAELGDLSRSALREELIVNLQQIGLHIFSEDERQSVPDYPKLNLAVHLTPLESFPVYSVFITLSLRQHACLTRNLIVCEPAVTWESMSKVRTISVSQLAEVRMDVHTLISQFVDDYQTENPKR